MSVRPLAHSPVEAPAAPAPIRLQHPELPAPERVMQYFELSRLEGWYSNGGPCARLLTDRLGAYLGGGVTVVPVANCTVGLLAALRATMGAPQPRRRLVLTPSFTFTATACAIEWAGFEPVFVDVGRDVERAPEHVGELRAGGDFGHFQATSGNGLRERMCLSSAARLAGLSSGPVGDSRGSSAIAPRR